MLRKRYRVGNKLIEPLRIVIVIVCLKAVISKKALCMKTSL